MNIMFLTATIQLKQFIAITMTKKWLKHHTTIISNELKDIKYLKKWKENKNKISHKVPNTINELY